MPPNPQSNLPSQKLLVYGPGSETFRKGSSRARRSLANQLLQNLIESLREELRQFGEMLVLLEQQRELLYSTDLNVVQSSVNAIHGQAETLRAARSEREQRRRDLSGFLGLNENTNLADLILHLPADYQPLLQALLRENHELHARSLENARQNQDVIGGAIEVIPEFLDPVSAGEALTA